MLCSVLLALLLVVCPPHEGKHEQIDAATAAIALAPQNVDLRLARAEVYLLHGELQLCAEDLAAAQTMAPDESAVLLMRARLQHAQKKFAASLVTTDSFLAREPVGDSFLLALHLHAQCHTALQHSKKAVAAWSELLSVHPRPQPDWFLQRARLQAAVPKGGKEAALLGLEHGIHKLGLVVALVLQAAELEEQLDRTDAAVARIETLAERSPRKESWLKRQGDILHRAGRRQQACDYYQRALSALEKLPPKRRDTFSMKRLRAEIEACLER